MIELDTLTDHDGVFVRLWRLDQNDRTLFVTHLTDESATRYQFHVTDPDAGVCSLTRAAGMTPPRIVVEILNENGYTVSNVPNITDTDPDIRTMHILDSIEWLSKHGGLDPGDMRVFAYERAQTSLTVVYASYNLFELLGAKRYIELLESMLASAAREGRAVTKDDLLDQRTHDIEFLQTLVIQMRRALSEPDQERISERFEERLGITASEGGEPAAESNTWESQTQGGSTMEIHPDAIEELKQSGWLETDST